MGFFQGRIRLASTVARGGTHQGYHQYEFTLTGTGRYTCGGRFGSLGYEKIDAATYAEWGIDYLSEIPHFALLLTLALSDCRHQSMIIVTTKARVGLPSFRSTGTQKCPAH